MSTVNQLCTEAAQILLHSGCTIMAVHSGGAVVAVHSGIVAMAVHSGCVTIVVHDGCVAMVFQGGCSVMAVHGGCVAMDVYRGCVNIYPRTAVNPLSVIIRSQKDTLTRIIFSLLIMRLQFPLNCSRLVTFSSFIGISQFQIIYLCCQAPLHKNIEISTEVFQHVAAFLPINYSSSCSY